MNRPTSTSAVARSATAFAIAVVALLAIVASGVLGSGATPSPSPSPSAPTGTPTPIPTGSPVVTPTPVPSDAPTGDFEVDLENAIDRDVSVLITDKTRALVGAKSGRPGDGMTVRWFDSKVENLDAKTLRIVWVGLPRDEQVQLSIDKTDGGYRIRVVQAAPPANSDATGYDRILILTFDGDVSADDVKVVFKEAPAA